MGAESRFREFLKSLPLEGADPQDLLGKFTAYAGLIRDWSKRFNLVSKNDLEKIWTRHFMDSLMPLSLHPDLAFDSAIDVGSGAGFPGVPVKIVRPATLLAFADSTGKKCSFIQEVLSALGLANCEVANSRAEILGQDAGYRERFDVAFTRALAQPPAVLELAFPFVKVGGVAIFWAAGPKWEERKKIDRIANGLGCSFRSRKPYRLAEGDREREIVIFEKKKPTDPRYPRRTGVPEKSPLK